MDNYIASDKTQKFIDILHGNYDKFKLVPWMVGGLGTATLSNKSNAKQVKTCPIKCPTFNEAQKVSQQIEQVKADYKSLEFKGKKDFDNCLEKIQPLLNIKNQYI